MRTAAHCNSAHCRWFPLAQVRCIVPMSLWGSDMSKTWVYVVADIVAAGLHALFINLVPPHHVQVLLSLNFRSQEKQALSQHGHEHVPSVCCAGHHAHVAISHFSG